MCSVGGGNFFSCFLVFIVFCKLLWHDYFHFAALIGQNVIELYSVARDLPCLACVLWIVGWMHCSWVEILILLLVQTSPTFALSLWLCLFGKRDSAAWEEPAFVRMSGVPWFRSYCHLLLFRRGGRVEWKDFTQPLAILPLHPFSWALLKWTSVMFDFWSVSIQHSFSPQ